MAVFSSESTSNVALNAVPLPNKKSSTKKTKKRTSGWDDSMAQNLQEVGSSNSVSESEEGAQFSEDELNDDLKKQNSKENHYQEIVSK